MKKILIFISILSLTFTQELKVEGNLNVTGHIQNQTIDSLLQVIQGLQSQIGLLQNGVTSKLVNYDCSHLIGNEELFVPISEFVGEDLEFGLIQFSGFSGELNTNLHISFYSSQTVEGGLENHSSQIRIDGGYQSVRNDGMTNYYFDSQVDYIGFHIDGENVSFNGTLHFIVTSNFTTESSTQQPQPTSKVSK